MSGAWLEALGKQGLDVRSARDAVCVPGWLDTGNHALNWAISGRFGGGYPLGHSVEIFGDPSTGKSFLIARALACAQAQGGVALLDDTEGAYNLNWMQALGVDVDHLAYENSRTVDEHLKLAQRFIAAFTALFEKKRVKGPGMLACDSLAQLTTKHEVETQLDKRDMTKAAELKAFFRLIGGQLIGTHMTHISANHTIANIGNMWNPRTTPGGGGPKFQCSVRVDLRGVSKLRNDPGEYIGVLCRAVVEKNRLAAPWKEVRLAIPFYRPISPASGLIPVLLDLGILEQERQMLRYQGQKLKLRAYMGKTGQVNKKRALEQDEAGERLLDMVPELLEEADARLAVSTGQRPVAQSTTVEDFDEAEDE
jgi:recombination protein RecA